MNNENKFSVIREKYEIKHPYTEKSIKDLSKNVINLETLTEKTDSSESLTSNSDKTQILQERCFGKKLSIDTRNDISKCDTRLAFVPCTPVLKLSFSSIDLTPPSSPKLVPNIKNLHEPEKEEKITCSCNFMKLCSK